MSHRTRDDKIILVLQFLSANMRAFHILQSKRLCYRVNNLDFFANGIDQMKFCVRKKNGQWNTRKTTACTYIKYYLPRQEIIDLRNA